MWHTTADEPAIVYDAEESSAMDRWLVEERGFTIPQLMGRAGAQLADAVRELVAEWQLSRVVFMVGPGNNGGDALVARDDVGAEIESEVWKPLEGGAIPALDERTLVVDGLFGVGLARAIGGTAREAVERVNGSSAKVLSVDIPSGISATSGEIVGVTEADPDGGVAVRADATISFVGPKRGFFVGAGPAHVARWKAVEIGFPVEEAEAWVKARRTGH